MELQGLKQGPKVSNNWEDLLSFSLENTKNFQPKKSCFPELLKHSLSVSTCFRLRYVWLKF